MLAKSQQNFEVQEGFASAIYQEVERREISAKSQQNPSKILAKSQQNFEVHCVQEGLLWPFIKKWRGGKSRHYWPCKTAPGYPIQSAASRINRVIDFKPVRQQQRFKVFIKL